MNIKMLLPLAVAFALAWVWPSRSAPAAEGDFRAFALRHAQAADLEPAVARVLPPGTEVVADVRANRLLVRGEGDVLHMAETAIASLDRPPDAPTAASPPAHTASPLPAASSPSPAAAPASPGTVLRVYPCDPTQSMGVADRLRARFARTPGVRVAADPRTGQLLVLAPAETHAEVGKWLQVGSTAPAPSLNMPPAGGSVPPSAPSSPPAAAAAPAVAPTPWASRPQPNAAGGSSVVLRHRQPREVEAAILAALPGRLTPIRSDAGLSLYVLQPPAGGAVELAIDHNAGAVAVRGPAPTADSALRLVQLLDRPDGVDRTQLVSVPAARTGDVNRAIHAIQREQGSAAAMAPAPARTAMPNARPVTPLAMLFQQEQPAGEGGSKPAAPAEDAKTEEGGGLVGPVQIEMLEGLDIVIVRGSQRDVEQVMQIIKQIEQLSQDTQPAIEVYPLAHVDGEAIAELVTQLYAQVFAPRQGDVSITPLVKPNSLLVVGRPENVRTALDLVKRLDQPVPPESQFQIFGLRHATATAAQQIVQDFFTARGALGTKARVTVDYRTNALVVQASPRDLAEVSELISRIDVQASDAVNELKIFKLDNSLAAEIAGVLQEAISGQMGAVARPAAAAAPGAAAAPRSTAAAEQKSTMLRFLTVDPKGQRLLKSGILTDVRITADVRANTLIVSAPAESMELVEALIRELDRVPAAEAQIKVFTIVNADALSLVEMLQGLFPQPGAALQPAIATGASEGESTLVPLRFAVDARTNSIIVSGSMGDLSVVEAILLRLDDSDVRHRKSTVYRLKNAPAEQVATAINEFLRSERQVQQQAPGLVSPFEQIEREVIVVPEAVSNSLVVSATPRFYDEIQSLVEQLDKRPPMVMIQVLIAEVALTNFDEFGIEVGLQDSVLFDRSLLGDLVTTSTTLTQPNQTTQQTTTIVGASNTPGYNFNNQPLGNSGSTQSLSTSRIVGGQGLSNFSVGRTNSQLGYGGLVLSASSESVSVLIRALQECRRLDILSRPQVMTLDNQPAFIQVGQRVPRISGTQINETGQINRVTLENVGLMLGVTPRISPDGLVVMEIDAEKSELGPEAEGIPISILPNGQVIRSPRIDTTTAQTTVSAMSGQTVVLGGLIRKSKTEIERRVPYLASIPILGNLFKYRASDNLRNELLIIMTPHIVQNEEDAERLKQVEAARVSWCLADVHKVHGDIGLRGRGDEWLDAETKVVYPEAPLDGAAPLAPEPMPTLAEPVPVPTPAPRAAQPTPAPGRMTVEEKVPSLAPKSPPIPPPMPPPPLRTVPVRPEGAALPTDDAVRHAGYQWQR